MMCSPSLGCEPVVPPVLVRLPVALLLHRHRRPHLSLSIEGFDMSQQDIAGRYRGADEAYREFRYPTHVSRDELAAQKGLDNLHCNVEVNKC